MNSDLLKTLEKAEILGSREVQSNSGCDNICDDFCNDCPGGAPMKLRPYQGRDIAQDYSK